MEEKHPCKHFWWYNNLYDFDSGNVRKNMEEIKTIISNLFSQYNLGDVTGDISPVSGGLDAIPHYVIMARGKQNCLLHHACFYLRQSKNV